jgi:hypothetical protein
VTAPDQPDSLYDGPPEGQSQQLLWRQGVVQSWNAVTAENVVRVGGTDLTNLSVLITGEETSIVAGDTVAVVVVAPRRGARTMLVLGRVVAPPI